MKRTSCLSRNFFRRPAVRDLVPDLKLLLAVLTVGCESHVGVWVPVGLGEDAGLDPAALAGGMEDLERRNLVVKDHETGEVFLKFFLRDNVFRGEERGRQARGDFRQIQSEKLKNEVLAAVENSPECGLSGQFLAAIEEKQGVTSKGKGKEKETPPPTPSPTKAPEPPQEVRGLGEGDFSLDDLIEATVRARANTNDPIKSRLGWERKVREEVAKGNFSLLEPGRQLLIIEARKKEAAARHKEALKKAPPPDPVAQAAGQGMFDKARQRRGTSK